MEGDRAREVVDVRLDLNCVHTSMLSVGFADRNRHMARVIITIRIR